MAIDPDTLDVLIEKMEKHGLTYLEVEGVKLVRNPQLVESPLAPAPADPHPREIFREKEPPSNYTHPDLWPDGQVVNLEDYTQTGEDKDRGGSRMR